MTPVKESYRNPGKVLRRTARATGVVLALAVLATALPPWAVAAPVLAYLLFGALDVARNDFGGDAPVLKRYFAGNGLLTWALSPLNLLFDLLSRPTKRILKPADLPADMQAEIREVLGIIEANQDGIIRRIEEKRAAGSRIMLMFRWYGRTLDTSIPALDRDFRYFKTIGISAFLPNTRTKFHYGPLRLTYRLLYNLVPAPRDDVYIDVGRTRHLWRDDPCFIFDDTLMHRSVNDSDRIRYCVFADIMRPSPCLGLTTRMLNGLGRLVKAINKLFYKNWAFI